MGKRLQERRRWRRSFRQTVMRSAGLLACWLIALLAAGCISRTHAPYRGLPDHRTSGVRVASFEDLRGPVSIRLDPLEPEDSPPRFRSTGSHRLFSLVAPSVGANGQDGDLVRATYYQSTAPGRHRLVVVLPIWGASTYPPGQIVHRLTGRHVSQPTNVLAVHGERTLFDWQALGSAASEAELLRRLAATTENLGNSVMDVRRLIGWAERRRDVDPARIGLVGFSIGAVAGSLLMGQDDRVAAGVFVMGGANLHQTFASCRGRAGLARRLLCRRFGWDAATFSRKIEGTLAPYNPARYADRIHPSRVLLVDAAFDHCMPESARTDLWEAMGRPERISLTYGHHVAFFSMTPLGFHYTTRRIIDFLDRRLRVRALPTPVTAPLGAALSPAR